MTIRTVAVQSPGDMGHAIGQSLVAQGFVVLTSSRGRSDLTRERLVRAGMKDLPDYESLVREADIVLSVVPPQFALDTAKSFAAAMRETGRKPLYVDCNAIAPATVALVESEITGAGAEFVDGGIVGMPPGKAGRTMLYVSGAKAASVVPLAHAAMDVVPIGPHSGQASAFKMLYAGFRKGSNALYLAMMIAAEHYGLYEVLDQEFKSSQTAMHQTMQKLIPLMPSDSVRWAAEMEEIMATVGGVGLPRDFHQGAFDIFTLLSRTPFAAEAKERVDPSRTARQTVQGTLAAMRKPAG